MQFPCRAYIMIVRNRIRGEDFSALELALDQIWSDPQKQHLDPGEIKCPSTVYGHYDVIVPIEAKDLLRIHQIIDVLYSGTDKVLPDGKLRQRRIRSTTTMVAINPKKPRDDKWPHNATFVGINCASGKVDSVLPKLQANQDDVVVADLVFGEFDIIAVCKSNESKDPRLLLKSVFANDENIRTTTTMIGTSRIRE